MSSLGVFTSKNGNNYDCQFEPNAKIVSAIGPLPKDTAGSRGEAFTLNAESKEEAIKIIEKELLKDKY